jgi:transposase
MERIIETTIGCDLGDKLSEISILRPDGELERPRPVKTKVAAMRKFFTRAPAHVVIEVGPHSRWVSDLLRKLGHRVTVANPRRVKLIAASGSKTDRKDAELLGRLGRADVELLAPIQHRGREAQADLAVAKSRDVLVRCRTRLVNFSRGLVKSFGERFPTCSARAFHNKARAHVPPQLKVALAPGQDDPQLRITKAGDPFLRRLLVQSAHYILGPFGKDSDLRRWGLELTRRGAKNGKKRATVAVARKLAVLMHRLWVTGEVYEPIGYGRAA